MEEDDLSEDVDDILEEEEDFERLSFYTAVTLPGLQDGGNSSFVERLRPEQITDYSLTVLKGFLMRALMARIHTWSDVFVIPERMMSVLEETTNRAVVRAPELLRALIIMKCK